MTKKKELYSGNVIISVERPGIVVVEYADDFTVTLEIAHTISREIQGMMNEGTFRVLHLPGLYTDVDAGVREYLAAVSSRGRKQAEAILVRSLAQRIKANAYLRMQLPDCPTYLLHSEEEAKTWLAENYRE